MQRISLKSFLALAMLTACVLGASAAHAQIVFDPALSFPTGGTSQGLWRSLTSMVMGPST